MVMSGDQMPYLQLCCAASFKAARNSNCAALKQPNSITTSKPTALRSTGSELDHFVDWEDCRVMQHRHACSSTNQCIDK